MLYGGSRFAGIEWGVGPDAESQLATTADSIQDEIIEFGWAEGLTEVWPMPGTHPTPGNRHG
jgi:hypothetical protein